MHLPLTPPSPKMRAESRRTPLQESKRGCKITVVNSIFEHIFTTSTYGPSSVTVRATISTCNSTHPGKQKPGGPGRALKITEQDTSKVDFNQKDQRNSMQPVGQWHQADGVADCRLCVDYYNVEI